MKQIVDKYYSEHYDKLIFIASCILCKINREDLTSELVNHSYFFIIDNLDKIEKLENIEKIDNLNKLDYQNKSGLLESIIVNYMHKQVIWKKTDFKKTYIDNQNDEYDPNKHKPLLENQEDDTIEEEELLQFEKEITDKMAHIYSYIANADRDQQILFNLILDGYNTSGKLAKHTRLSRTTCYGIIKKLKNDIKNSYNK